MGGGIGDAGFGQASLLKNRPNRPNPTSGEARLGVHRIVPPADSFRFEIGAESGTVEPEQGADNGQPVAPPDRPTGKRRHGSETVQACAAREAEQECFGLIVAGVAEIESSAL